MSGNFGKYSILAQLGSDGIADVLLTNDAGPAGPRKLVLKRLREDLVDDPDVVANLLAQARIAAGMKHPNLVNIIEVGTLDDDHFLTMELLEGQSLDAIRARADEGGVFSPKLEYLIVSDVLAGLDYAHEFKDEKGKALGLVHGDVSPRNVFVTYGGRVTVVDFAFARMATRAWETRQGIVGDKAKYMSPEQAKGETLDRRTDVFAAGVILWEAATGLRLWSDTDDLGIIASLRAGSIPSSAGRGRPVPQELARICSRALAPRPADRYATAAAFKRDLDAYLDAEGLHARAAELAPALNQLFANEKTSLSRVIAERISKEASRNGSEDLPALWREEPSDAAVRRAHGVPPQSEVMNAARPGDVRDDVTDEDADAEVSGDAREEEDEADETKVTALPMFEAVARLDDDEGLESTRVGDIMSRSAARDPQKLDTPASDDDDEIEPTRVGAPRVHSPSRVVVPSPRRSSAPLEKVDNVETLPKNAPENVPENAPENELSEDELEEEVDETKVVPQLRAAQLFSIGSMPISPDKPLHVDADGQIQSQPSAELREVEARMQELVERMERAASAAGPRFDLRALARRPVVIAVAAGLAAALVGATCTIASRKSDEATAARNAAPSASTAASSSSQESDQTVALLFSATPLSARFRIDSGPLLSNPHSARVQRDDTEHTVEILADGFLPRTYRLRFNKDIALDVALGRPDPPAASSPGTTTPPPPWHPSNGPGNGPHLASPGKGPASNAPKRQQLDTADPWK